MLTKTETPADLQINMRDDPEYRRATEKLDTLKARAVELDRQREAINVGLTRARVAEQDHLTSRAEMLLADAAVPRPGSEELRLRSNLSALEDELAVTRKA